MSEERKTLISTVDAPKKIEFSGFVTYWVLDDVTLVCLCFQGGMYVCESIFSYFYFRSSHQPLVLYLV